MEIRAEYLERDTRRTRSRDALTGFSQSSISRIWRAFGLQRHRSETFKLSTEPLFIEKVRDISRLGT